MKIVKQAFSSLLTFTVFIACFDSCKKNEAVLPAPVITDFSPVSGAVGSSVTINGSNFGLNISDNQVKFNGVNASISHSASTSLTVTVPAGATTGKITVTANGKTATSASDFTVLVSISSFAPASATPGSTVVISGSNFDTSPANNVVKFNGIAATVTASTSTSLTVTVPLGATTGKISVSVNGAVATSATDFIVIIPAITDWLPYSGAEGSSITILGTGFGQLPADNSVKFNGISATVTQSNSSSLTVIVPSGATTGKITVTINGYTTTSASDFQVRHPSITSFTPSSGVAGTSVTITGTDFFSSDPLYNIVKFNGVEAKVTGSSCCQLTVTVPETATTGTITVDNATSASSFTILAPVITDFSPTIGSAGVSVVITGSNFSTETAYNIVKFNGTVATVTNATSTQVTATVPAGSTTGKVSVMVGPNTVTSAGDFTICSGVELLLSNVAVTSGPGSNSTSFNYAFDLTNVGGTQAILTSANSTLQAYVSTDDIYNNGNELAASGWGIDATINAGGSVYHGGFSANIVGGGTVGDHPYLILVFSTTAAITECNTSINHIIIKKIIP